MKKVLVINGPNINFLGIRNKFIYGFNSLLGINNELRNFYFKRCYVYFFQGNCEGKIISCIQDNVDIDGIIINPGALSHTSYALVDVFCDINKPCIEVHISNIYQREYYRHKSLITHLCMGQISGFGLFGYYLGIEVLIKYFYYQDSFR